MQNMGKIFVDALSTTGFVYLKNHGIDSDSLNHVNEITKKFFELPLELKNQYKEDQSVFGYVGLLEESLNPSKYPGYKEIFNISGCFLGKSDTQWPDELLPLFSKTIENFMEQCKQLTLRLLEVLAVGLNLQDKDEFLKSHSLIHKDGNYTALRCLYYPPVPENITKKVTRLGEHSDYGSITLLFQDDVGGLQVQTASGEYMEAAPIEGTMLVNIGDALQFWTGGKLKSTKHKVDLPPNPTGCKSVRRSIAYFVLPNNDVRIDSPLSCVSDDENHKNISSKPLTFLKYLEGKLNNSFDVEIKL